MHLRAVVLFCLVAGLSINYAYAFPGGHGGGGHKKVIIHVPFHEKTIKHTHTVYKTIHHKSHGHEDHHDHYHHDPFGGDHLHHH